MNRQAIVLLFSLLASAGAALAAQDEGPQGPEVDCDSSLAKGTGALDLAVVAFDEETVAISCRAGLIDSLVITLPPGAESRIELGLIYRGERVRPLTIRVAASSDGDSDAESGWLKPTSDTANARPDSAVSVSLAVRAGRRFEPGSVHRLQVEFHIGEGRASAVIPVILNVGDESPLFRSRFEVDPVLGQFSYRPASSRSRPMTGALPVAAGGE